MLFFYVNDSLQKFTMYQENVSIGNIFKWKKIIWNKDTVIVLNLKMHHNKK